MAMKRTIEFNLDDGQMGFVANEIGSWDTLWEAVGFLVSWRTIYPTVRISRKDDTSLVATYFNPDGSRGYVINAIWHDDHYGFHPQPEKQQ